MSIAFFLYFVLMALSFWDCKDDYWWDDHNKFMKEHGLKRHWESNDEQA